MAGLYPKGTGPSFVDLKLGEKIPGLPDNWQAVPIHTEDRENDTVLYGYKNCPRMKNLVKRWRKEEEGEWKQKEKLEREFTEKIGEKVGCKISIKNFPSINALLKFDQNHNASLPKQFSREDVEGVARMANWVHSRKFPTEEVAKMAGGNILRDIYEKMITIRKIVEDPSKAYKRPAVLTEPYKPKITVNPVFVHYSAHDGTILGLISAMRNSDQKRWETFSSLPFIFSIFLKFQLFFAKKLLSTLLTSLSNCTAS